MGDRLTLPCLQHSVNVKSLTHGTRYHNNMIYILCLMFSEQMELELQGQDLQSVIHMEDQLLKNKGEVGYTRIRNLYTRNWNPYTRI